MTATPGVADDGHTITRTATITPHGYALLAFGIWGAAAEKIGRRWGIYGGGVSDGFFGYHVFLLHPEFLICWLLVFLCVAQPERFGVILVTEVSVFSF